MVAVATKRFDANAVGYIDQWKDEGGAAVAAADVTSRSSPAFSGAYIDSASAADVREAFTIDTGFVERMAYVLEVRVHAYHRSNSGTALSQKLLVRINATNTEGSAFNSTTTPSEYFEALARPGGGDWTEDDFRLTAGNAFNFGIFHPSQTPQDIYVDELWVEVDYIPLARTIDHEREVASRKLNNEKEPEPLIKVVGGWDHAAGELMDLSAVAHTWGPSHDQQGWGVTNYLRAFGRYRSQTVDLLERKVTSVVADRRRRQTTFWELMAAVISSDPDVADGLARLDCAGADREFSRSSKAWIEDVGGEIIEINEAKEKIEPKGTLIEGERTNYVPRSSFVNGTTGWTKTENTGTGDFAIDTDNRLFSTDVTTGSGKITLTTTPSDVDIAVVTAALGSSAVRTLSADWFRGATQGYCYLQNDTTGNYLQQDGSWGASPENILTDNPGNDFGNRAHVTFTTESTDSTHTLYFGQSGDSGDTLNIGHVQIEDGSFPSSRIVTEASSVTRLADLLTWENSPSLAQRIWPVDKFTAKIVFTPEWNQSDLTANRVLLELYHDNSNLLRVTATTANTLGFFYIHGGTTETASYASASLAADTEYTVVIRRCSDQLEYGNADGQITIFLNGVKGGTQDATGTDLTEAAAGVLNAGMANGGVNLLYGWLKEIRVSPVVFSDAEIAAGL